jgi:hypothetical protein
MRIEPGMRVVAIKEVNDAAIRIYGRGVYKGETVRINPKLRQIYTDMHRRSSPQTHERIRDMVVDEMMRTSIIMLDDGVTVYGCECWFIKEEHFDRYIGSRRVVVVPITDLCDLEPVPVSA